VEFVGGVRIEGGGVRISGKTNGTGTKINRGIRPEKVKFGIQLSNYSITWILIWAVRICKVKEKVISIK